MPSLRTVSVLLFAAALGTGCATSTAASGSGAQAVDGAAASRLPSERVGDVDTGYNVAVTAGLVGDVVKGDEFTLQDGTEVRLIGIKAPIAAFSQRIGNYYGKGALELTRKLAAWKNVRLEYDAQVHDRRGRLLAYVHSPEGSFIQEELLKNGLAFAETFPPNVKYRDQFIAWQLEAMEAKRGIWALDPKDYPRVNSVDKYVIEGLVVKRVLNGDSVQLDDGTVVRYVGIDAPDSENRTVKGEVGHAAYMANKMLVEGKEVTIEYDIEPKDPRGRELAYVFIGNKMVNAELVRDGHAIVAVFPPNVKYLRSLFEAQSEAAKEKRGLWSGEEQ